VACVACVCVVGRSVGGVDHHDNLRSIMYCNLTGTVPSEWALLTSLESIDIHYNALHGQVPTEFQSITALTSLYVYTCVWSVRVNGARHSNGGGNFFTGVYPFNEPECTLLNFV
jgi:hypothetical protein